MGEGRIVIYDEQKRYEYMKKRNDDEKLYKISSVALSQYLRSGMK
jgi:hypothetical protein